jgi:hypothetical protein
MRSERLSGAAKIPGVNARVRTIAGISAAVLLLGGGAIAAVSATGRGTAHHERAGVRHAFGRDVAGRDLATASSYLGVPVSKLEAALRSGQSLAQIAGATPGHSTAGLVSALVSAKRARLEKAIAMLGKRVQSEVARAGDPHAFARGGLARARLRGFFAAPAGMPAASYLGIAPQTLLAELKSGKTLAEIARARGRSEAGLISAIVTARKQALESALAAGAITQAREQKALAKLEKRVHALVNRSLTPPR